MHRKDKESKFSVHVKALVFNEKGNVLILKKKNNVDSSKDLWDLPGGNLEFGENVYNAVWRIVKDHTDLDTDIQRPCNIWTIKESEYFNTLCVTFFCRWDWEKFLEEQYDEDSDFEEDEDPILLSKEYQTHKWATPYEVVNGSYPVWIKNEIKNWQSQE